jgi:hypothetical protein
VTTIRITVGGRTLTAQLADNPTARDLAGQMPLTLRFRAAAPVPGRHRHHDHDREEQQHERDHDERGRFHP